MKAMVVGVEHESIFTDKRTRVTLRFADADAGWCNLRVPAEVLGSVPALGTMIEFQIWRNEGRRSDPASANQAKEIATGKW